MNKAPIRLLQASIREPAKNTDFDEFCEPRSQAEASHFDRLCRKCIRWNQRGADRLKVLLDTSAYSALQRGEPEVLEILQRSETVGVPAIVLGEFYSGFRAGTRRAENEQVLAGFLLKKSIRIVNAR